MKDYLDEKIKSEVDIEYSFKDIVNRIDISSKVKGKKVKFNWKLALPSFAVSLVLIVSFIGLFSDGAGSTTTSSEPISSFEGQVPGGSEEQGFHVSSIPQTFSYQNITYNVDHSINEEDIILDTLICHMINEEDLTFYQQDFPSFTPIIVKSLYDYHYNNRVEVYSVINKETSEFLALKGSFGICIYKSE